MTTIVDSVSATIRHAIEYLKLHAERISRECSKSILEKSNTSVYILFAISNFKLNENGLSIYVKFNGLTTHHDVDVTVKLSGFWIHVQNFNMLTFQGVFTMDDFIHRWHSLSLNAEIRTFPSNTYTMDQFIDVFSSTLMQSLFSKRFSATTISISSMASPAFAILSTAHTPLNAHVSPLYSFVSEPTSAPTIAVSQANTCTKDLSENDENVNNHWTKYMKEAMECLKKPTESEQLAKESLDSKEGSVNTTTTDLQEEKSALQSTTTSVIIDDDDSGFDELGSLDALFEDETSTSEIGKKRTLDQISEISEETKERLRRRIAENSRNVLHPAPNTTGDKEVSPHSKGANHENSTQNATYRNCISPEKSNT